MVNAMPIHESQKQERTANTYAMIIFFMGGWGVTLKPLVYIYLGISL